MGQQIQPKKTFEPLEKAKLAMRLVNNPGFEKEIDEYVSGKDYDEHSVNFFKKQIALQQKLQQESGKLLDTGGQIFSLVINALAKSWQRTAGENNNK
ncbi:MULTISPECIES: hypothetical protein [Prosthecochloris]|uniref:Uncharacterized protein n=1 Tax=Prosthecochloris marina TaxID=2017681 RepID=A0A317TAH7_9CHLB|nr:MULTISPECIES: hypothetical protein [Prosthecochloris]PWW82837.1 hypothetical protein CR164_03605 [Prosthecochloris marina]UZJ37874.1 hypothetical protein OO005_01345 [Prosthecochloris sp. SCSIO W1103]UZJ41674.1 hypothetical protein OO006_01325 [Prosthecochloris sp. SCSIO W1101]